MSPCPILPAIEPIIRRRSASEQAVLAANDEQLSTVALRPRLIWGPGDRQLGAPLADRQERAPALLGSGDYLVDSTLIDNVVDVRWRRRSVWRPALPVPAKPISSPMVSLAIGQAPQRILKARNWRRSASVVQLAWRFAIGMICEGIWWLFRLGGEPPMTRTRPAATRPIGTTRRRSP